MALALICRHRPELYRRPHPELATPAAWPAKCSSRHPGISRFWDLQTCTEVAVGQVAWRRVQLMALIARLREAKYFCSVSLLYQDACWEWVGKLWLGLHTVSLLDSVRGA